jgi:hypothetical protein
MDTPILRQFLFSFSECSLYNGQGFSKETGHFTQLVWKSCETYGMATQTCNIPGKDLYQVWETLKRLKPNYFKKQCSSSSFLLNEGNDTGPNWPGVLRRLVPCI